MCYILFTNQYIGWVYLYTDGCGISTNTEFGIIFIDTSTCFGTLKYVLWALTSYEINRFVSGSTCYLVRINVQEPSHKIVVKTFYTLSIQLCRDVHGAFVLACLSTRSKLNFGWRA